MPMKFYFGGDIFAGSVDKRIGKSNSGIERDIIIRIEKKIWEGEGGLTILAIASLVLFCIIWLRIPLLLPHARVNENPKNKENRRTRGIIVGIYGTVKYVYLLMFCLPVHCQ